jgi:EmrB/QacA subfamily drug resistance transporter
MSNRATTIWTFAITSIALFMVSLDNLVVTTAIPSIREDLGASLEQLEWTVNAYTLTFAVFLLTGAALGDRFGRRRLFAVGVGVFTLGSVVAALAPNADALILGRAVQGFGGAIVMPLTLTLLSAAVPAEKRGLAIGAWGGIGGLAIAIGPLVGGAIVEGLAWQWIFWLNVPIGIALVPLALLRLRESHGPSSRLDLPGLALVSTGLFGIVWGLIRGNAEGWTSPQIVLPLGLGALLVAAFVVWELRAPQPMLPMRFFRNRAFSLANAAGFLMFFGMFGAIFLLIQQLQTAQGYGPLAAGAAILPWTLAPMFISPWVGALADRIGEKPFLVSGLALQAAGLAWLAALASPTTPYLALVTPFVLSGVGMSLFFAPSASLILRSVAPQEEGQASGAMQAIRELGGVFGVAVLASVFARTGSFESAQAISDGVAPAVFLGAALVAVAALVALALPGRRRARAAATAEPALDAAS